jgi:CHRD domain/PEP-CTERM motif
MLRLFAFAVFAMALMGEAARADVFIYEADLSGPAESPPNASPGTGFAEVIYDDSAHTMHVQVSFSGLLGTTTASHIHSATTVAGTGTAGVATQTPTFMGFPLGVTSGTYDNMFDMTLLSFYNGAFVTANGGTAASAEAALASGLAQGKAYLNIHTTVVPGGEIRGFLTAVPEPSSIAMLGIGSMSVLGFSGLRRWRRKECARLAV